MNYVKQHSIVLRATFNPTNLMKRSIDTTTTTITLLFGRRDNGLREVSVDALTSYRRSNRHIPRPLCPQSYWRGNPDKWKM